MQQVVAADARLEQLAEGFRWSEGPIAVPLTGDILFSDVPENKVYRWNEAQGLTLYLQPSGYTGLYPQNNRQRLARWLKSAAIRHLACHRAGRGLGNIATGRTFGNYSNRRGGGQCGIK
ncbi:hypothetical protein [Rheinheimera gaetbuli]